MTSLARDGFAQHKLSSLTWKLFGQHTLSYKFVNSLAWFGQHKLRYFCFHLSVLPCLTQIERHFLFLFVWDGFAITCIDKFCFLTSIGTFGNIVIW